MKENPESILNRIAGNYDQRLKWTDVIKAMEEHAGYYKDLEQSIRDMWVAKCIAFDEVKLAYELEQEENIRLVDILEREEMNIQQLKAVIRERGDKLDKLQKILKETATRTHLIFPDDSESINWFNDGTDYKKSDFFIRIYDYFGVTEQCDKCGRALSAGLFCPDCDL